MTALWPTLRAYIDVTNKPTNPSRSWTEISSYVRGCSYTLAGRSSELEQTQPGSLQSLVLDNRTGRFDRGNTGGPYYGALHRAFWIKLEAVWAGVTYRLWTGVKETLPKTRPAYGMDAVATVTGRDSLGVLELIGLGGRSYSDHSTSERVAAVLADGSIPAGTIDTGYEGITLPAVTFEVGDVMTALSHLTQVEQDERGLLVATADGSIDFQGRYYRALLLDDVGPIGVLTDDPSSGTDIRYADAPVNDDGGFRANIVTVTPYGGGDAQVSQDDDSIEDGFERRLNITMLTGDELAAQAAANWYRHRFANPDQRIGPVPVLGARNPGSWPTILSAAVSDLVTVEVDGQSSTAHLERVSATWQAGQAPLITWDLSPASRERIWRLGVVGSSELGVTTRLG